MKHLYLTALVLFCGYCSTTLHAGEGVPFFRNYPATEYGAHNRNFDVVTGKDGRVFFANFEGLLCYDHARWQLVRTPGYSRVTCLLKDRQGTIWIGGYNLVGKVTVDDRQQLSLHTIVSDAEETALGEVAELRESDGKIRLRNRKGTWFEIQGETIRPTAYRKAGREKPATGDTLHLGNGQTAVATSRQGIVFIDTHGKRHSLTEADGLCSNHIVRIATDGKGCVWGVTDNGIFCVYAPSLFSRYGASQGVKGEVTTICRYRGKLYIGTLQGLYAAGNGHVTRIPSIHQACWQLQCSPDGRFLYAATAEGVFRLKENRTEQLTRNYAQTLLCNGNELYVAETDCLRRLSDRGGKPRNIPILDAEHIVSLSLDATGGLTAEELSGRSHYLPAGGKAFLPPDNRPADNRICVQGDTRQWSTDTEGRNLACIPPDSTSPVRVDELLYPLHELTLRTVYPENDSLLWVGGDFGAIRIDLTAADGAFRHRPQVFIREICAKGDSLQYGKHTAQTLVFDSSIKEVAFRFASDAVCAQGQTAYRFLLEGYDTTWNEWTEETEKAYANLPYGSYTFQVQARDAFGRYSGIRSCRFSIERPFYLQWYSLTAYAAVLAYLVLSAIRWRLRKLVREKARLEQLVAARTRQINEQKEEIEKKSSNLETALDELRRAQEDLLRQEKMATVGKLTRGLIDRILNPLNYINNFSHLSYGLAGELRRNLQDAEEQMDRDNYEDSADLLEMLTANLGKIERHGNNTSRIVKAMEEILKEGSRARARMDVIALCRQSEARLYVYYQEEMERMGVSVQTAYPQEPVFIDGNEEQLGKTWMSLLANSMYALAKKYGKQPFKPEIGLKADIGMEKVRIHLKDNGTGIEETVMEQVFDPFFTTKTTGEAAGVGLYLCRETITAHGGEITVSSRKGEYTEFVIELPIIKE